MKARDGHEIQIYLNINLYADNRKSLKQVSSGNCFGRSNFL